MPNIAHTGPMARIRPFLVPLAVIVAVAASSGGIVHAQEDGTTLGPGAFSAGAPLDAARVSHRATLLDDGRVLMSGGYGVDETTPSTAEVYDAESGASGPAGPLAAPRYYHSANLLADGRVLLIGGTDSETAEIWDPASGSSHLAGSLTGYRSNHTATMLADGRVLITGGYDGSAVAEVYDPVGEESAPAATLAQARSHHTGTPLADGRVLLAGGPAAAELWDPASESFSPAGTMASGRIWGTATGLSDGRILLIGGGAGEAWGESDEAVSTAELWDPASMTFAPAGSLIEPRLWHTATLLPDGRVLVAGGVPAGSPEAPLATAELWDPATMTFTSADSLAAARGGHSATLMPDGRVLIAGGSGPDEVPLDSTEIWDPGP